ncbi:MAG: hypothetical protein ACFFDM_09875 [Candidatus Thorarchaeota archaeon]
MKKTFFDVLDGWTLMVDRGTVEITLNEISRAFNEKRVVFQLLEDLWDLLEQYDEPTEFMTDERLSYLIEKLLRKDENEKIARFVELELSGPPYYETKVLNVDETISEFPTCFKEYTGMTWDDFKSSFFDK